MNKIFNRETLITNFIPFALLYLPMYFISTHYFGEWAFLLILYGFLMFGVMMVWSSWWQLQQVTKQLRKSLSQFSDKEIDLAVNHFEEYTDAETAQVIRAEVAKFRHEVRR